MRSPNKRKKAALPKKASPAPKKADAPKTAAAKKAVRQKTPFAPAFLSSHSFESYFDLNPAIKLVIDSATGRIVAASQSACEFYGYTADEFSKLAIKDLDVMPLNVVRQNLSKTRRQRSRIIHVRHRTKSGAIKHMEVFSNITTMGKRTYHMAVLHDITALVEAENRLRRNEKRFRTVLENTPDAITIHDNKGVILDANQRACESLGYPREELIGMPVFDIEVGLSRTELEEAWANMTPDESVTTDRARQRRKDGAIIPVETSIRLFTSHNKKLYNVISRDITQRLAMEKELARARESLQAIMDNTLTHIWAKDLEGRYLTVNRQWEKELRIPFSTARGKTDYEIFSTVVASRLRANDRKVIERRAPITAEETIEIGGTPRTFIAVKFPLRDAQGEIYAVAGIGTEVTEIKKAEEAARESEARYAAVMQGAQDAIIMGDEKGNFIDVNLKAEELTGYSRGELLRMNLRQIHPPDSVELSLKSFARLLEKGSSRNPEGVVLRKDGARVPVDVISSIIEYRGRKLALAIFRDMTDRNRAEMRMRMLQNAIEQAAETVIITNADAIIQYANPSAEKMTGFPIAHLLGKKTSVLKSSMQRQPFYERLWRTIKTGHIWKGTIVNRRADGTHYEEEITISPVMDGQGKIIHFVSIHRDISEQKRLQQQLIHADKLSSIGTFVAGVAHELNNPLTAVMGFSNDLLRRTGEVPPDIAHLLGIISGQSRRAVEVVKNLLAYSRPHKPERRTFNLNELVATTAGIHQYRLKVDGIDIATETSMEPLPLYADPGQVQQVIVNILLNAQTAIKIAGQQGKITLRTEKLEEWDQPLGLVAITNSGPSIPENEIDQIFDPYFTTKKAGEGIGLGLYISYGIVRDFGGELWAENRPEGGVTFYIRFPLAQEDRPAVEAAPAAQPKTVPPGTKVLVVDDEAPVKEWLTGMLLRNKVFAVGAGIAREAIDYLQNGSFDAVVSDFKMPEMDGIAFYDWLAQHQPEMTGRFIFLSGAVENRLFAFCEEKGLTALIKPVGEEAIIGAIAQSVSKGG